MHAFEAAVAHSVWYRSYLVFVFSVPFPFSTLAPFAVHILPCTYVCVSARVCACMHVRICLHLFTFTCTRVGMRVCMFCLHSRAYVPCIHINFALYVLISSIHVPQ